MAGGLLQDVLPVIVYALEFITRHTLNLLALAVFLAHAVAPWRVPWALKSVCSAKDERDFRRRALSQAAISLLDVWAVPHGVVALLVPTRTVPVCRAFAKACRDHGQNAQCYNYDLRFQMYGQMYLSLADLVFAPLGLLALAVPSRTLPATRSYAASVSSETCGKELRSHGFYNLELRRLFIRQALISLVDVAAVPLGLLALCMPTRARIVGASYGRAQRAVRDEAEGPPRLSPSSTGTPAATARGARSIPRTRPRPAICSGTPSCARFSCARPYTRRSQPPSTRPPRRSPPPRRSFRRARSRLAALSRRRGGAARAMRVVRRRRRTLRSTRSCGSCSSRKRAYRFSSSSPYRSGCSRSSRHRARSRRPARTCVARAHTTTKRAARQRRQIKATRGIGSMTRSCTTSSCAGCAFSKPASRCSTSSPCRSARSL